MVKMPCDHSFIYFHHLIRGWCSTTYTFLNGAHRLFLYPTGRHRTEVFSQHQTHVHITNFHTEAGTIQLHIFSSGECQSDTATSHSHVPRNIAQKFPQVAGLDRLSSPLVAFIALHNRFPFSLLYSTSKLHVERERKTSRQFDPRSRGDYWECQDTFPIHSRSLCSSHMAVHGRDQRQHDADDPLGQVFVSKLSEAAP